MTEAASAGALRTEIELAVLAGRSLEQIEAEILTDCGLDEESVAAMWLYAWCYGDRASPRQRRAATAQDAARRPRMRSRHRAIFTTREGRSIRLSAAGRDDRGGSAG
jgi:hypothetical protein